MAIHGFLFSVEMEIHEEEVEEILRTDFPDNNRKKKRKGTTMTTPDGTVLPSTSATTIVPGGASLETELAEAKQRLERVTKDMEVMKNEIESLRRAAPKPLKIFALGFIPSVVLAKNHVDLLKWVTEVLSISMKKRMEEHVDHFSVIKSISGVESVGARTCPTFNRIERCVVKWHQMSKTTGAGKTRAELRLHCCTLCIEALGIISGHPLLKCPWVYEETWSKLNNKG